jgi:hypothetical protein
MASRAITRAINFHYSTNSPLEHGLQQIGSVTDHQGRGASRAKHAIQDSYDVIPIWRTSPTWSRFYAYRYAGTLAWCSFRFQPNSTDSSLQHMYTIFTCSKSSNVQTRSRKWRNYACSMEEGRAEDHTMSWYTFIGVLLEQVLLS